MDINLRLLYVKIMLWEFNFIQKKAMILEWHY